MSMLSEKLTTISAELFSKSKGKSMILMEVKGQIFMRFARD